MIACLIILTVCLLILLKSGMIAKSLRIFTVLIFSTIVTAMFREHNIFMFALQIAISLLIVGLFTFIQVKIKYDFTSKIISFTYIFNSLFKPIKRSGDRIIGRVLPYNNYQLKYNGKYLTMNEITTAGATLISGSTGSGKTTGVISCVKQNIVDGKSVIFAEYKGDPAVVETLVEFAESYNFEIFKLSNNEANFNYDPLQNLNNVGRIEALMNMRKWSLDGSDAHYKTGFLLLLQKLIGDFSKKYNLNAKPGSFTIEFLQYVKTYHPTRDEWDAYSTTSKLLELLLTSSLEPMFKSEYSKTLDFGVVKNKKFLVIISFISSNKELATSFSSLLFRDLLDECTVKAPMQNINLYIDEFGTLENPFIIKDILEKGRSGKIGTTLTLLDINQIVVQTSDAYLNSILGIINTFIVYNGATRVTAEKFAGVQLLDIESVLMNLRKPGVYKKSPTAIYISKYPTLNKKINSEVFRFEPYIYKGRKQLGKIAINQTGKKMILGNFNEINKYNESDLYKSLSGDSSNEISPEKKINLKEDEQDTKINYDDLI